MKKKIVVKVSLADEDARREAMMLAVKVPGVVSATMDKAKGQIMITGDDIDPVAVTKALRGGKTCKLLGLLRPQHSIGPVDLVTVEEVKEDKKTEEKKQEVKKPPEPWSAYPYNYSMPPPVYEYVEPPRPNCWYGWW